ncbi:MAG: hypothetical protein HOU81_18280 [Hamadaea sp.]|uniref:hypothetical protein n=1 Tax=Hamadaea sp. TaxID=2024425 RepID=UPI0017AE6B41|nr:hypothetical protein [Hamadaea sp.]NUR72764.1 hypothetical protein [Hamadaea sp.]NUT22888.1 hypothetical protein [Hamadaea sp.]
MTAREDDDWRQRRDDAVAKHAAAVARAREIETTQARKLVTEFVEEARRRLLPPERLMAFAFNGRSHYRTGLHGWYIHPNHSLAIGVDGEFYVLGVPASLRSRLLGARPAPSDPMLVIGRGAKDGESISLRELLHRRLAANTGDA